MRSAFSEGVERSLFLVLLRLVVSEGEGADWIVVFGRFWRVGWWYVPSKGVSLIPRVLKSWMRASGFIVVVY